MILETADQRTDDWYAARCGKATASRFKDAIAALKSGAPAQAQRDYLTELVVERLTQQPIQRFQNAAMTWGTEQEPAARAAYERVTGISVEETGFIAHDTLMAGCSPDGLVDWDGLVEIKCPWNTAVHIETLLNGMPDEHIPQVQGQMWITGRQWCDFVSYDPRMPAELQLHVQRINRDPAYVADLERRVTEFLAEVGTQVEALRRLAESKK
ncbi:MAG: lambda exonuclease family protein [Phycisphaerales bacterium]